ncbi:MAG: DMT family transporter [Bacteroidales bacterium]|nr:DMT family transporter [Bacteroidales bacterium]
MTDKTKGFILGAIAAATYGTNPLFAIPLYADGMDVSSVLFLRYSFAVPMVWVMMAVRGRTPKIAPRKLPMLVVMGVMLALSSIGLFTSYNYMDSSVASTLLFVYPVMVALIMTLVYRERLSGVTIGCIGVVLCGIALLNRTVSGVSLSMMGIMLVMLASLTYAIYIVGINRPVLKEMPTLTVTFYVLIIGALIFGGMLLHERQLLLPRHWYFWGNILALAVLPTIVSFACTTSAIQYIGPTPTAILGALEPVVAVIFGITVFGDVLSLRQVFGVFLILAAVTVIIGGGNITRPLTRFRHLFPRLHRR